MMRVPKTGSSSVDRWYAPGVFGESFDELELGYAEDGENEGRG